MDEINVYIILIITILPQVDVVYIGNLHVQHLQTVLMMFEAGKPVLCEKPMTTSVKNATTMIQAASNKGLFLMEVHRRLTLASSSGLS